MKMILQAGFASLIWMAGIFSTWFMPKMPGAVPAQSHQPISINQVLVHSAVKRVHKRSMVARAPLRNAAREPELQYGQLNKMPTYECHLSGRVTNLGQPYGNAELSIAIRSGQVEETRTVRTAADGSYDLRLTIKGSAGSLVDWQIRGLTVDLKAFETSGRRILVEDQPTVEVKQPVEISAD